MSAAAWVLLRSSPLRSWTMSEFAPPQTEFSARGRILCGWCNRVISVDPSGATRHVTCDECRNDDSRALAPPAAAKP